MKKIAKIIGIALVCIVAAMAIVPMAFKGKIKEIVISEASKLINAEFGFEKLNISLFREFPQASVGIEGFWLHGKEAFASDTLAYVGNAEAKQQYINGHFCYADKFAILTNGLGIIRHIQFLDDDFKSAHPEMANDKKSDSPDEDKSIGDSSALKPVLNDFFSLHPDFKPDTFLGDAAFDFIDIYGFLKDDCHFKKVLIPLNQRNESTLPKVGYNTYGYPTCPNDPSLFYAY